MIDLREIAQCTLCATIKCEICRVLDLIVSEKSDLRKDRYDEIRRILIKIAQGYQLLLCDMSKFLLSKKSHVLLTQGEKFLIPYERKKLQKEQRRRN